MSVIEGIYHNPDTGTDERRALACDANGRLLLAPTLVESWNAGAMIPRATFTTPTVDLGEATAYTLLIARKSGIASKLEALEIQTSVEGTRWLPAAGIYRNQNAAWYRPPQGSDYFTVQGRPIGRFVRIVYRNGQTDQTDLVLELAALAGA